MNQSAISVRYAKALFDLASEQKIENQIANDIELAKKLLKEEPSFYQFLTSPAISITKKKSIASSVFENNTHTLFVKFILYVIEQRRESFLLRICLEYTRHYYELNKLLPIQFVGAIEPSTKQVDNISQLIKEQTSKTPVVETSVDESLLGGFQIIIGDKLYDRSIRGRLDKIKNPFGKSHN